MAGEVCTTGPRPGGRPSPRFSPAAEVAERSAGGLTPGTAAAGDTTTLAVEASAPRGAVLNLGTGLGAGTRGCAAVLNLTTCLWAGARAEVAAEAPFDALTPTPAPDAPAAALDTALAGLLDGLAAVLLPWSKAIARLDGCSCTDAG